MGYILILLIIVLIDVGLDPSVDNVGNFHLVYLHCWTFIVNINKNAPLA